VSSEVTKDFADETFVVNNPDGSISLDADAGLSREDLKRRCSHLRSALLDWQMIAMHLAEFGKSGLAAEDLKKVETLVEGYRD